MTCGWFFGPEGAVQGLYFSLIPELSQPAFESCPSRAGARRQVQLWPFCRSAHAILRTYCKGGKVARLVGDVEPDEFDNVVKTVRAVP
jgi:hypothetical protein